MLSCFERSVWSRRSCWWLALERSSGVSSIEHRTRSICILVDYRQSRFVPMGLLISLEWRVNIGAWELLLLTRLLNPAALALQACSVYFVWRRLSACPRCHFWVFWPFGVQRDLTGETPNVGVNNHSSQPRLICWHLEKLKVCGVSPGFSCVRRVIHGADLPFDTSCRRPQRSCLGSSQLQRERDVRSDIFGCDVCVYVLPFHFILIGEVLRLW